MKSLLLNYCVGVLTSLTVSLGVPAQVQAAALNFDLAKSPPPSSNTSATAKPTRPVALVFAPDRSPIQPLESPDLNYEAAYALDLLFAGGSASLVARAVGSAEGTRTPNGG